MNEANKKRLEAFLDQKDENGQTNRQKIADHQKVIRRVAETDKSESFEEADRAEMFDGIVVENGRIIGFGIHIFNEDIYPLQSFEIYLRNCDLCGNLDLDGQEDMVFLDLYHNRISSVRCGLLPAMRIFGVQDNRIEKLDVTGMPICQGIDAGMNRLKALDVSENHELVELYINDNAFTEIDLSHNPKLKYFYCHNNHIQYLDTRANPLLRHLNATGNPMKSIRSLAPQREAVLPLELYAGEGGRVGLKYNPVYNAQWKETGEWQQSYYACPEEGFRFDGWYENETKVSEEEIWIDEYGTSRILQARFRSIQ